MKAIYLIHAQLFTEQFPPRTTLARSRMEFYDSWSTAGGASKPLYGSSIGDLWVTILGWTKEEAHTFASLWGFEVTTMELPDEEADAVIAQLNRNLINNTWTPPDDPAG